ncbi:C-type lectin 1-like isoform X2 [Hippoglossus hippoglossus]|uniref:C-type lectin 1-like isoform X2 n=1 Tax=Hippoglossus hippoglossus TaxID=8267 RepID=UPI00148CAA3A|nr:C-type lectin 1-like isoform X2 [Hippoglossus hippoglossus]
MFKAPSLLQRAAAMEETLACLLLLLSSSCGKYVYVEQKMNWAEAQTHCRTHYTDLAAIGNKQDTERLQKLAGEIGGYLWMGLESFSTDGVKWMWSGGAEVSVFFWDPGQPENRPNEHYGLIQKNGWHDAWPHYKFPFFCFSVVVVRQRKTWEQALDHCRERHLDLASVTSLTEMLLIQSELEKHVTTEHVWIGLHFFPDGWRWVDGRPLEYEAWREEIKPACPRLRLSCAALQVFRAVQGPEPVLQLTG